jgi:hypothetical protein
VIPMNRIETREFCSCGDYLEADLTDDQMAQGFSDIFWTAHQGQGHGKAGPTAARLVRQRREQEAMEAWT